MNNMEQEIEEIRKPVPLESLPPLREVNSGKEWEKSQYWNTLLTGDPSTVPAEVRHKAGADDESRPAEERDYQLMSSINRSWVVDHRGLEREKVRAEWPELRRNISRELGVRDTEPELFTALSVQNSEAPVRQKARQLYEQTYHAALQGKDTKQPEDAAERSVYEAALQLGYQEREQYMPLAESLSEAWELIKTLETDLVTFPKVITNTPDLVQAVDALADMDADARARVYAVARSLDSTRALEEKPAHLGEAVLHSMRRGTADVGHSLLQGIGHVSTALTRAAGETFDSDTLRRYSIAADKRLQALHELRSVAQGELFPIDLGEDAHLAEQMAVDAAGAIPGAAMAFMGGAGFAALTLAGTGAAVAEARQRSPKGRQELQTAAGILAGGLQAGIYMGMTRVGAQMLNRTIANFMKARNAGVAGYSLAALQGLGTLTAENAKMLLAGKAAQATELGMQELAARVDKVASNIDWESFGDNFTDIETNMREAAMNLPYVLIASGRAALHHFRSPSALLDNGEILADWGVNEATRKRILDEPDIHAKNELLREALCSSRRWAGTGPLEEVLRSLKLLNTEHHIGFQEEETARAFLQKRADRDGLSRPELVKRDVNDPETFDMLVENATGKKRRPLNAEQAIPYLLLYDEWFQLANGEMLKNKQQLKEYDERMLRIAQGKPAEIPKQAQLNGFYSPFREEAIRAVMNDYVEEVKRLGYRYLLNTETLDSLRRINKSQKEARYRSEQRRALIHSEVCAAIDRWQRGMPREESLNMLCERIGHMYMQRRHYSGHAPRWLRDEPRHAFTNCYEHAVKRTRLPRKTDAPQLVEAYRIILSLRSCADALMQVIPHTRDFQDALCMAHAPADIYAHLLNREFGDCLDRKVWDPKPLSEIRPDMSDNRARYDMNSEVMLRYSDLSGNDLESTPDGKGGKLWRMKRPDGRYTPWFEFPGYVVNSVVGNVETSFLPMGKNMLIPELQRGMVKDAAERVSYLRSNMFPMQQKAYLGYDHLCNTAARDLCAQWMGDSTLFKVGLEFVRENKNWTRYKGRRLDHTLKLVKDETDRYLVRHSRPLTPLSLAQLSFKAYWNRMLSSKWVEPEEVADLLVRENLLSPEERDQVLEIGRDYKMDDTRITGSKRRIMRRRYPNLIHPGDPVKMNARLASCMSELNVRYMLAHMRESQLPNSVKQWFYTTPFSKFTIEESAINYRERLVRANRIAAEQVKEMIPDVAALRRRYNKDNPIPLEKYLRNAYEPDSARRFEQGWCFAYGGERTFRAAGQALWNLLDDPARGWKLLPESERTLLQSELADVFGTRSPEAAMQELGEVLQKYPELRAYGITERGGSEICRMSLNPIQTDNIAEPDYTKGGNTRVFRPDLVQKGYSMENQVELPPEYHGDERVMPALRLLSELRRSVVKVPYVGPDGIWWDMELYGGVDGKPPGKVDNRWTPEVGLESFMRHYERVAEWADGMGADNPPTVCGVKLGGIRPGELDTSRLRYVTVYRTTRLPDQMVRLMPGMPDSASPHQRAPYVVQTSDGIPLLRPRMARKPHEIPHTLTPLNLFDFELERMYDYASNCRWRKRQLKVYMDNLLKHRTRSAEDWERGEERNINNEEMFMQIFQDSRLSYFLLTREPDQLTRGEALTSELARHMLLAEFGVNRDEHVQALVEFCDVLRKKPEDVQLIQTVLNRVVSPYPNNYSEEELPPPLDDDNEHLPEDADFY